MKYLFLKGNWAKKIYNDMSVTLGDKHPSTVKNWVARFRTGHLSTEDEECSGRQLKGQFQKMWMPFIL
jgi:transposase